MPKSGRKGPATGSVTVLRLAVIVGALLPDMSIVLMWLVAKSQGVEERIIWSKWYFSDYWQQLSAITNSIPVYALIASLGLLLAGRHSVAKILPFGSRVTGHHDAAPQWQSATTESPAALSAESSAATESLDTAMLDHPAVALSHNVSKTIGRDIRGTDRRKPYDFWQKVGVVCFLLGAAAALHAITDLPLHVDDGHPHFWPLSNWIFVSNVSYWDPSHYGHFWGPIEMAICVFCLIVLWRRTRSLWGKLAWLCLLLPYALIAWYWGSALG